MIYEIHVTLVPIGSVGMKPLVIKQLSPKLYQTSIYQICTIVLRYFFSQFNIL